MVKKKWVFAVHKWETATGKKHDVSYGTGRRYRTKSFTKWKSAAAFARKKALEMKLKQYQIDTPKRPHVMIKVSKPIIKKKPQRKKPQGRSMWDWGL